MEQNNNTQTVRQFDTGATRDLDEGKLDYEGCFSPLAGERFAAYMYSHSFQGDGSRRPSDNWQKGIPLNSYMKSMMRHMWDVWKIHRGYTVVDTKTNRAITLAEALCAVWFNVQGYLHELLKYQNQVQITHSSNVNIPADPIFHKNIFNNDLKIQGSTITFNTEVPEFKPNNTNHNIK